MPATRLGFVVLASLGIGGLVTVLTALLLARVAAPRVRYRVASTALTALAVVTTGVALGGESPPAPWLAGLGVLWIGGIAVTLVRLGNSLRGVARLRESARPAGRDWQERLDRCAVRLGLTRPVALLVSEQREVPCTVGVRAHAVIFPAHLLPRLSTSQWEALALHELVHVRRRDYAWHLVHSLIAAIFFYHPGVHWLAGTIAREREACCDLEAAAACGALAVADSLAAAERHRSAGSGRATERSLAPLRSRVATLLDEPLLALRRGLDRTLLAAGLAGAASLAVLWPAGSVGLAAPSVPLAAATGLGLAIGLRHAFEPDHLMAVATLVAAERDARESLRLGASWGVGHTLALLAVGSLLIAARQAMPDGVSGAFEFAVAAMIFLMGSRALINAWRMNRDGDVATHLHGDLRHAHAMAGAHLHIGGLALATRPLIVGLVHGLAGSGALTAMAIAALPEWPQQLSFVLLFGLGSTAGMAAVTGLAGWPVVRLARTRAALAGLSAATGVAAIVFSLASAAPAIVDRLGR